MRGISFWDTNLLIYWLEQPADWSERIRELREWHRDRDLAVVTSALTLAEILVHPLSKNLPGVAKEYKDLISEMGCYPFGVKEAWRFAEIRSAHPHLKPPDCIQLACASVHGVDYFFTNDTQLADLTIEGVGRVRRLE